MDTETLKKVINANAPTRKKSIEFLAMLFDYHHYDFTVDSIEAAKMYGKQRFSKHQQELAMIICEKLLKKPKLANDPQLLKMKALYESGKREEALICFRSIEKTLKYKGKQVFDVSPSFTYFRSYLLSSGLPEIHNENVKYRLYLNVGLEGRAEFAKKYMEACEKKGIPYFFKVFGGKDQTDTIVIYVDTLEHLAESVTAIDEIYNDPKNSTLRMRTNPPSPHLTRINEFVGYGFEPKVSDSYTTLITSVTNKAADKKNALKAKIEGDFKLGRRFRSKTEPDIITPSVEELKKFHTLKPKDKLKFFRRYKDYIFMAYGKEIKELYTTIEQEMMKDRKFAQQDVDDSGER